MLCKIAEILGKLFSSKQIILFFKSPVIYTLKFKVNYKKWHKLKPKENGEFLHKLYPQVKIQNLPPKCSKVNGDQ